MGRMAVKKVKKPSGCCYSRTARRVSENTDCNYVNFNRETSETQVFSLKFLKSVGGKKDFEHIKHQKF